MMHLPASVSIDCDGRKGGCWSGLMYPNRRIAQGHQTASVCSLSDWFLSRLASVSAWKWKEWELFWNEEGSSIYLVQLRLCVMDGLAHLYVRVEPIYCQHPPPPPPFVTGERRERLREGGGRRRQGTGEGGGGRDGKREAGRGGRGGKTEWEASSFHIFCFEWSSERVAIQSPVNKHFS